MRVIPNRTSYSETVHINNRLFHIDGFSVIGGRNYMEDTFMSEVYDNLFILGVFDGHGGSFTSKMLPEKFKSKMTPKVRAFLNEAKEQEIIHFFNTLFFDIDEELKPYNKDSSGSTAILCVITKCLIILVNCGDSRGILYSKNGTILIETVDHTPHLYSEKERIKKLGGTIQNSYIEGLLSVSRSFGDYELKKPKQEFISVRPDVYIAKITQSTVVLGSDGIFNRINPSNVSVTSAIRDGRNIINLMIGDHYTGDNKTVLIVKIL